MNCAALQICVGITKMITVHILRDGDELYAFKNSFCGKSPHYGCHTKKLPIAVGDDVVLASAPIFEGLAIGVGLTKSEAVESLSEFTTNSPVVFRIPLLDHAQTWAEMTKYPRIFDVYWGNFSLPSRPGDDILANRNKFVEDYKIVKKGGPQYARGEVPKVWDDHRELYKCAGGFIAVRSPYRGAVKDTPPPVGWLEVPSLYRDDARTIVRFTQGRSRK